MRPVERAIQEHYSDVRRYARSLSRNRVDAEELVQDCMIRALSRPCFWNDVRDPRAYLMTILHNTYVDGLASRRRHGEHLSIYDEATPLPSSPATQMVTLELREVARRIVRLPRDQRWTMMCIGFVGLTYQETAILLDVPVGTVMSRVSRARNTLRCFLDGQPEARLSEPVQH